MMDLQPTFYRGEIIQSRSTSRTSQYFKDKEISKTKQLIGLRSQLYPSIPVRDTEKSSLFLRRTSTWLYSSDAMGFVQGFFPGRVSRVWQAPFRVSHFAVYVPSPEKAPPFFSTLWSFVGRCWPHCVVFESFGIRKLGDVFHFDDLSTWICCLGMVIVFLDFDPMVYHYEITTI